jgi:hypothetical protein
MERKEFIDQVFTFFKNNDEELKKAYDLAFTVKENIDWDKLYRIVLKEAETRYLPAPKWFVDKFYRCNKIDNFNFANNQQMKVIVTLQDDYQYEYDMEGCTLSQKEIIDGFNKRFKGGVKNIQFIKEDE